MLTVSDPAFARAVAGTTGQPTFSDFPAGDGLTLADLQAGGDKARTYAERAIAATRLELKDDGGPAWVIGRPIAAVLTSAWATLHAHGARPETLDTNELEMSDAKGRMTAEVDLSHDNGQLSLAGGFHKEWLRPALLGTMPETIDSKLKPVLVEQIARRQVATFAGRAATFRNTSLEAAHAEAQAVLDSADLGMNPKGRFIVIASEDKGIVEWAPGASCKQFEVTHACPTCPLGKDQLDAKYEEFGVSAETAPGDTIAKMTAFVAKAGKPLSTLGNSQIDVVSVTDLPSVRSASQAAELAHDFGISRRLAG